MNESDDARQSTDAPVVGGTPELEALRDELLRQAHALEFGADSRTLTGAHATIAIAKAQAYRGAANRLAALVPRPEPRELEPPQVMTDGGQMETFVDTPLLQAKRRAFDSPTQTNLDALIEVAQAAAVRPASAPSLEPNRVDSCGCRHKTEVFHTTTFCPAHRKEHFSR